MTTKILNFILLDKINKFINDYFNIVPKPLNNDIIISIVLRNRNSDRQLARINFYLNLPKRYYCTIQGRIYGRAEGPGPYAK
jgi:hypothetical protein